MSENSRGFSPVARLSAGGALLLAIVLVTAILLTGGSSYHVRALFTDAGGLVTGDAVLIGPAQVGSVDSVSLTPAGQAAIIMSLNSGAAPLHRGTVARIEENGLAGIASHYVTLEPAPSSDPSIPSGGTVSATHTFSEVSLDQVFDTLDPLTRAGLRNVIRGEAAAIQGKAVQANRTLHVLAPALLSTSQVTAELSRNEPAFDGLLVQGARTMQALAARSSQLSELVSDTDTATGAIAGQARALQSALRLLPGTLRRSVTTFAGLRTTLDRLDPVVAAAKPNARRLKAFAVALDQAAVTGLPTVTALAGLLHNPSGSGDLTQLLTEAPALARVSRTAFPELIRELNDSQSQLDYLREYTPDVIAALTNLGQASGYYDANGHYTRTQPFFGAYGLSAADQLVPRLPADRYDGLEVVHARCPGGAVQASGAASPPKPVAGCNPTSSPPGP
ncbi:MAG TPA: MlaD family protein [Solirubrobacteraceae bacterium]|nr:MlaD family protein [Solirubrobacteraceae bacterium]